MSAVLVAVLVVSGLSAVLMVGSRGASAATPQNRSLNVGLVNLAIVTFNPMKITLVDEYVVIYNVMSTLVTYSKSYNTVVPNLAKTWSVSPDGVTWTMHLVHDAYFTDPTNPADRSHPVTAADVVFTYNLNKNITASILNAYTQQIASVTAIDPYTVQIVTKGPDAAIYSTLTTIPIMPEYVWAPVKNPINYKPSYPIGSDAMYYNYALSGSSPSAFFVLSRNPNYFGQNDYCQYSRPTDVYFVSYSDPTPMVQDFVSGNNNLNAILGLDPLSYTSSALATDTHAVRQTFDTGFVGEYSINVMTDAERQTLINEGFSQFGQGSPSNNQILATNLTVRRAVAESINKTYLVKNVLYGLGSVGDTLVPDSNPWHYAVPPSMQYTFNPALARQQLYAAGWAYDSSGNPAGPTTYPLYQYSTTNHTAYWPLSFRLYTLNTEPYWATAVSDIVGWLHEAGIQTTDSRGVTSPGYGLYTVSQLSGIWFSGDYDMWLWDWVFSPASDPSTDILQVETTGAIGPTSDNFYSNATYDALYNQSLVTLDHNARQAIVDQMQMMIYNYSSYILPYYQDELYAYRNDAPSATGTAWTNWGNWTTSGGLTPDSDMPWLWLQVYPANQAPPTIQSFPSVSSYTGIGATFTVTATDPENDIASYNWDFGDGTTLMTTTGTATHTYATAGTYTVSVTVSDGEWPACASTTATIVTNPGGTVNLPPSISSFIGNTTEAVRGTPVRFTLNASDPEGDSLYVTWNWSDGSPRAVSFVNGSTTNTSQKQTLVRTHTFATAGTYRVVVNVTDNQSSPNLSHYKTAEWTVTVTNASSGGTPPPPSGGGTTPQTNPWVDYGVPAIIAAVIIVAVAAVLLRRRRETKEDEQEKEDTQAPRQNPPPPQ